MFVNRPSVVERSQDHKRQDESENLIAPCEVVGVEGLDLVHKPLYVVELGWLLNVNVDFEQDLEVRWLFDFVLLIWIRIRFGVSWLATCTHWARPQGSIKTKADLVMARRMRVWEWRRRRRRSWQATNSFVSMARRKLQAGQVDPTRHRREVWGRAEHVQGEADTYPGGPRSPRWP